MKVELPYGEETRELLAPSGATVDYINPCDAETIDDVEAALDAACSTPVDTAPLSERVSSESTVLVVIADLTRSPATRAMLPAMVERLVACGVDRSRIRVLVARGTHRSLTREEKTFLRSGVLKGIAVEEHDCDDGTSLCALLLTKRGTPVRIHRAVRECDLVVLLSPISFHYFAGFGGGRKLILPGCADRDAILANHRLSLKNSHPVTLHPSCRAANLDGNPVHDDMVEVIRALGHLYAVNFFTSVDGGLAFVNTGDPVTSHEEACAAYARCYRVEVARPEPVVLASSGGWPHDINLLQAHKSLRYAAAATAPGGSILLFARCGEGVGSESLSAAIAAPRKEFLDRAFDHYALNNQTGVSLLDLTSRYRVAMVTELDDGILRDAGIDRCVNPEAWVADALESQRADRIAVITHAGITLPALKE